MADRKPSRADRMYGNSPSIGDDDVLSAKDGAAAEGTSFPKSRAALKKLKDTSPAADKGDDDG